LLRAGWALASALLCASTLSLPLAAQPPRDASDPPVPALAEPADIGILMQSTRQGFRSLEYHQAQKDSDFSFFAGQKTYLTIPGSRSPVRFAPGETLLFYLSVFLDSSDPRAAFFPVKDPTHFALYQVQLDDDNRRIVLRDEGLTSVRRDAGRPLIARIYGKSSFQLAPSEGLTPGEYAILYRDASDSERFLIFCFGVDGRGL